MDSLDSIDADALEAQADELWKRSAELRNRALHMRRLVHSVRVLRGEIDPDSVEAREQARLFVPEQAITERAVREAAREGRVIRRSPSSRVITRETLEQRDSMELPPAPNPTGAAAVRAVMKGTAKVWRVSELHDELERRGWISPNIKNPRRTTDATISRLLKQGEIRRVGPGRYRYIDGGG